jgi:hypothetical protein
MLRFRVVKDQFELQFVKTQCFELCRLDAARIDVTRITVDKSSTTALLMYYTIRVKDSRNVTASRPNFEGSAMC